MAKRMFDWVLSSVALLLLWPVLLVVALAVRLDSPGPVLFRQQRVGLHGQLFWIHKFRSMRWDVPEVPPVQQVLADAANTSAAGPQVTAASDARITRVGRFLRRSKLDELPQLWDVWRGAMSVVGPRPEVPRFMAQYEPAVRDQILSVRPGITDFASIEYRDESTLLARSTDPERTYREVVLPAKLALQARYVDEAGVLTDLRLILRTLRAIF